MLTQSATQPKLPSERSFGLLFTIVFAVLAISGFWKGWPHIDLTFLVGASVLTLLVTFLHPSLLSPLNKLWFKIGLLLGRIVSPIVVGLLFFALITPVGVVSRLFGRDALRLKRHSKPTYWVARIPPGPAADSFKNQF